MSATKEAGTPGHVPRASFVRSPLTVMVVVELAFGLWLLRFTPPGTDARDFVLLGQRYVSQSHISTAITVPAAYRRYLNHTGYDGQFYYYIALDPLNARFYLDKPAYRYSHIAYPLAARLLALGSPALVPLALIALNVLAIAVGTLAVAAWLKRRGYTPWLALVYGLSPGLFVSLWYDLAEASAFALVAVAVWLFDGAGRRRLLTSGAAFALAALTRETTAIVASVYGLSLLAGVGERAGLHARLRAHGPTALGFLTLSCGPLLLYEGFLRLWLGPSTTPVTAGSLLVPFHGLWAARPWSQFIVESIRAVVLPALICACIALWALWRRLGDRNVWTLLALFEVTVVSLPADSYDIVFSTARIGLGLPLFALYCLPRFDILMGKRRLWLWLCTALWLSLLVFWFDFNSVHHNFR